MNGTIDTKTVSLGMRPFDAMGDANLALSESPAFLPVPQQHDNGAAPNNPIWSDVHTSALDALMRAVDDASVFAALTGPKGSGTSEVLSQFLFASKRKDRVCVEIRAPNVISSKSVDQLNRSIVDAISNLSGRSVHVLFVVDNAHAASEDLLGLLDRVARKRDCLGAPQVVVAGEPSLWERLTPPRYDMLLRRFAVRCSLENQLH